MALKALMLKKRLDDKKKQLAALRADAETLKTREAELEQAIAEAETDEEQQTVAEAVTAFEADKAGNGSQIAALEQEIADTERELAEAEQKANAPVAPAPQTSAPEANERKGEFTVGMKTRAFFGLDHQERDRFIAREDVRAYLTEIRACIREKRALTNVGLTIPEVMLPLLRTAIEENSKLIGKVNLVRIIGSGRQNIMGTIPEAVWTEMCATLNELSLGFNDVEVDGYKVGGYFEICNATLEDSDLNLASELLIVLGKAIAKALDKAIIYGTGTKMPLGFVTRLAQTAKPSDYPATARTWKDLHSGNIITGTGKTGLQLFQEIATNSIVTINDYFADGIVWLMNKKTHTKLLVQSMDKNLNAAIVAGISTTMPVIGGEIIDLSFIPDDNIVFGYLSAYTLAERAGQKAATSEHVKFLEDRTVFKATARYDGKPVIPEAFGLMSITTTAPSTSVTFPSDTANTPASTPPSE